MRITFIPAQPHCFAFGGFEELMNSTYEALLHDGIEVSKLNMWQRNSDFDIVHVWGVGLQNYDNIIWAKRANKKVVATALFGDYLTLYHIFRFYVSKIMHINKFVFEALKQLDYLVVTNERHKEVAIRYFKFEPDKIKVIPNTLLSSYFINDTSLYKTNYTNYILTIGTICRRKNQARLIQAVNKIGGQLLLIGDVQSGEEDYGNEVIELIRNSKNIYWIKRLERNSPEIISIYKNCLLFALPSLNDQQPISAQEAGVMGKALLLSNLPYAKQKFYKNACLVNPYSINDIAAGISKVLRTPDNYIPPGDVFENCKEENVIKAYKEIYMKLKIELL